MTDLESLARDEAFARTALARTAGPMVPAPDPMTRLLARQHRHRTRRLIGGVAAAAAVLLGSGVLAQSAAQNGPVVNPDGMYMPGQEIRSEWTRRLITSPTRGNLATDTALVDAVTTAFRAMWFRTPPDTPISPDLNHLRLLFLHEANQQRQAVAVFYNDTHVALISVVAAAGADPTELVDNPSASSMGGAEPFVLLTEGPVADAVVALAPSGCEIAASESVDVDRLGQAHRRWTPLGDWTMRPRGSGQEWWQVTCDGQVRYRQPVSRYDQVKPEQAAPANPPLRGTVEPGMARRVAAAWQISSHGLGSGETLVWGGVPPGQADPVAVVAAPTPGGGAAVLALTGDGEFPNFADGPDSSRIQGPPDSDIDTSLTTGTSSTTGFIAVRLPDVSGAVSDRLLVIPPSGTDQLRWATAPDALPLVDGVAVVTANRPLSAEFQAIRDGVVVGTVRLVEPTTGPMRFGVELVDRW